MAINVLVYLSRMTTLLEPQAIQALVQHASIKNKREDITGVLLIVGNHFVQFLEGPENSIDTVFEAIKRDDRHCDVAVILKESTQERAFGEWSMTSIRFGKEIELTSDAEKLLAKRLEYIVEKRGLSIRAMKEMIVTIPNILLKQEKQAAEFR